MNRIFASPSARLVFSFALSGIFAGLLTGLFVDSRLRAQVQDTATIRPSTPADTNAAPLLPGEDLLYEVRYLSMRLGTIRIKSLPALSTPSGIQYRAVAMVNSYPGIPFVDLHVTDSTMMDSALNSVGFHTFEKHGDRWEEQRSQYELADGRIIITRIVRDSLHGPAVEPPKIDTLMITDRAIQDGLSVFFYAREKVRRREAAAVPTVVYGKRGMTSFHPVDTVKTEEIDAIKDKKIRVVTIEGDAGFKGLYGMTGDFDGSFTADAAAVPIKAHLGVFIGRVSLELVRWKRPGWEPPVVE